MTPIFSQEPLDNDDDDDKDPDSLQGLTMPADYSPTIVDYDGLPQAMKAVILSNGSFVSLTELYLLLDTWGEEQRVAVLQAAREAAVKAAPGPTLAEWNENAKHLLDSYPQSVRSCYKGGPENLMESMCLTFIGMRDKLNKPGTKPT